MDTNEKLRAAAELLSEGSLVRDGRKDYEVAKKLTALGRQALPELFHGLASRNPAIREFAAIALGRIGDQTAIPYLIDAAQIQTDRDYWDDDESSAEVAAIVALGALGSMTAGDALLSLLDHFLRSDLTIALYAIDALVRIQDTRALPMIESLLDHADFDARKTAKRASEALRRLA